MHSALATDAELSSHPIVQTVNNIDEVTAIFDEISYKKMFSIIRMMENSIKPTIFEKKNYLDLKKFMYQNSEAACLFKILQKCSPDNLNVTAITDTWTRQKGFPVVNEKKSGTNGLLLTSPTRYSHLLLRGSIKMPKIWRLNSTTQLSGSSWILSC